MTRRGERFFGAANHQFDNGKRAWLIRCAFCDNTSAVVLDGRSLSPDDVIKRFRKNGWVVGVDAEDDMCPECQKLDAATDPVTNPDTKDPGVRTGLFQSKLELTALREEVARLKSDRDRWEQQFMEVTNKYYCLMQTLAQLHRLLINDSIDDALRVIEQAFPPRSWEKRVSPQKQGSAKPRKQPKQPDAEFEQWLNDLQKQHHTGESR